MEHEFADYDKNLFEPAYKAIGTRSGRHGIRLENAYWDTLKQIAKEQNCTIGELVEVVRDLNFTGNTTSALRVCCVEWLSTRLNTLLANTDDNMIRSIIYAAPTPAIALSANKHLHSFNQPFLQKLTDAFSIMDPENLPSRLRLVMDVQIDKLIEQLSNNGNRPITVGIAIGVDDRRLRSQLKVSLVPRLKPDIILGFLQP